MLLLPSNLGLARDDLLSDIMVALLENRSPEDIRRSRKRMVASHNKRTSSEKLTLDAAVFAGEERRRHIDLITTSEVHFW